MNNVAGIVKFAKRTALAIAFLAAPATLAAQSCAMCYQSAAASGPRTIHALNTGILILMFPPALITGGIFYLGYKKRDTYRDSEIESE
jgi:hypothetical protein